MKKTFKILSTIAFLALAAFAVSSCEDDSETSTVDVEQVTVMPSSVALQIGSQVKLYTKVAPTTASDSSLNWTSSDATIAVVGSDGTVTGITEGTATITATAKDGSGKTGTCEVTVATNVVAVDSVSVDASSLSLAVGQTQTISATIYPSNATVQTVAWTSSDESVASVTSAGKVIALAIGTATIKATAGGVEKTITVTVVAATNVVEVSGEIVGTRNFVKDSVYLLKGFVYVVNGATLNIAAGTVIKGDKSTMGSLIVEKGGKINAIGTQTAPIVFTSNQAAGARTNGDWGGIILCGKAEINVAADTAQVEGGPRSYYGGSDNADNSGTLKYVRIEFAGYPFQPDKEINGLTLGGVGSGTTIDYIMVSYSGDDSYEWFGGTVKCKHLIAYRGLDDDFDTDYGYSGTVQFALGMRDYRKADVSGSNGFESDNDANGTTATPQTSVVFSNVTLVGPYDSTSAKNVNANFQHGMHIRRNSALSCFNSVVTGFPYGVNFDGSATLANMSGGSMKLMNVMVVGSKTSLYANTDTSATSISLNIHDWFFTTMTGNSVYSGSSKSSSVNPNVSLGLHGLFPTNKETTWNPDFSKLSTAITTGASFADSKLSGFDVVTYIGGISPDDDWTSGWANWTPQTTSY